MRRGAWDHCEPALPERCITQNLGLDACQRCPRLVAHHAACAEDYPHYWLAPVPSLGAVRPRVYIVGLAPGLHGAGRTGLPFTGDASGRFLFDGLCKHGFARQEDNRHRLLGVRISNAVKCLPPGNAPTATEVNNCRDFLAAELRHYVLIGRTPRVVLALGGLAHRAVSRALGLGTLAFKHGARTQLDAHRLLLASFHPSRLNVNTGRITPAMLDDVLRAVRAHTG